MTTVTVDRAVLEQALEALEAMQNNRDDTAIQRAITALRAALAQQEQDQMLECAYKSACDIVEEQDKKLAELEAVNAELLEALVSFTKSGYIKKQHPKRYAAAVAAIAKAEGEQK